MYSIKVVSFNAFESGSSITRSSQIRRTKRGLE